MLCLELEPFIQHPRYPMQLGDETGERYRYNQSTCGMGEKRTKLLVLYVVMFEDKHMIDAWSRCWTSVGTGGACVENARRSRIQVSENMQGTLRRSRLLGLLNHNQANLKLSDMTRGLR